MCGKRVFFLNRNFPNKNESSNSTPAFVLLEPELGVIGWVILWIGIPLILACWLRVFWWRYLTSVARVIPESFLIIMLGFVCGIVLWAVDAFPEELAVEEGESPQSELFFIVLLPLIIFRGSYFLDAKVFMQGSELVLILFHALLGTTVSCLTVGLLLWQASAIFTQPLYIFE